MWMKCKSMPHPPNLSQSSSSEPQNSDNDFTYSFPQLSHGWCKHSTIGDAQQIVDFT